MTYRSLMNGVSYMIPFVVVGGLLIAISLTLGGHTDPQGGLVIPDGSFWKHVNDIGTIGFTLMVPILSGYIAYAIGDRPALVPGMIGGFIANTPALYGSKAGAGFIGAIATGYLAGYLVLWIKRIEVPKSAQPIMPIIVIPIVATTTLGLFFIYVIGKPIAWVFNHLTDWLSGMTGSSSIILGAVLGLMIAFDMGGPVNKTAFLFGTGLIASGNQTVMGMCAAAIPVMPIGQGLATLIRRRLYSDEERETGMAALFMGLFGISEGAIPFAAARPAQAIPANMLGGAVAGAVAGLAGVRDSVPHGGPIVAVLGAVDGVPMFFVAVVIGVVVTAMTSNTLIGIRDSRQHGRHGRHGESAEVPAPAAPLAPARTPTPAGAPASAGTPAGAPAPAAGTSGTGSEAVGGGAGVLPVQRASAGAGTGVGEAGNARGTAAVEATGKQVLSGYLTAQTVTVRLAARDKDAAIHEMAALLAESGKVTDTGELVRAVLRREAQGTTGLGDEIAIPHAKTDAVTAPAVAFGRSTEGVEWRAPGGAKARLIFMVAVPEAAAWGEHLRILAALARGLVDSSVRERLLEADETEQVLELLREIQ
jgi:PTS system fructose-specific IIC component